MKLTLASSGRFDALLLDGWRISRHEVQPLADAAAALSALSVREADFDRRCEAALTEARAEGLVAGLAEGRAQAEAQAADLAADVLCALGELEAALRGDVGLLAMEAVRRFAGEIGEDRILQRIVEASVREVLEDQPFAIRARPDQIESLRPWVAAEAPFLRLVAGDDLAPGVCILETRRGQVRAGLPVQMEGLARALGRGFGGETKEAAP